MAKAKKLKKKESYKKHQSEYMKEYRISFYHPYHLVNGIAIIDKRIVEHLRWLDLSV